MRLFKKNTLLNDEISRRLPALGVTASDDNPILQVRLYSRWRQWEWYGAEFDGRNTCFGIVQGLDWDHFRLSDLAARRGPDGSTDVYVDQDFPPTPFSELFAYRPDPRNPLSGYKPRRS